MLIFLSFFVDHNEGDKKFEVYVIEDENTEFKDYFDQLQTFVLWYIDSSNTIDFDDTKWKIFIL